MLSASHRKWHQQTRYRALLVAIAALVLAFLGAQAASASTVRATPKCSGLNTAHMHCIVRFSNGPRAKVNFDQAGNTVSVHACVYGKKPAKFNGISVDTSATNAPAYVDVFSSLPRTCSLRGKTPIGQWPTVHGTRVDATVTLYMKTKGFKPLSTGAFFIAA
jgi:hypothetical protein